MRKNIPFIHSFCDRWCERCSFTSRCGVYEKEKTYSEGEKDIDNPAFFVKIMANIADCKEAIVEDGKKLGIGLEDITEEEMEEARREMERVDALTEADDLIVLAEEYMKRAHNLLSNISFWTGLAKSFAQDVVLGLCTHEQSWLKILKIDECRSVISWYHFFINSKFRRAVSGQIEDHDDPDPVQNDWNGSAKVAMLGVSQSREALQTLFNFTGNEDEFLVLLSLISRIQQLAQRKFPRNSEFIRPGFDEVKADMN